MVSFYPATEMSHLSPFRLSAPNLSTELSTTSSNPKKRRKNAQNPIQTATSMQDLLPPPLSGYGDTIVASNPFDDCPSTMSTVNMVRNPPNMGLGPPVPGPGPGPGPNGMGGGGMSHMNMCRPIGGMGSPLNMGSPMMHSPNGMQNHGHGGHGHPHGHMMNQPMMMNGPRMNAGPPPPGSMGSHLAGHMTVNGPPMMNSPNVNMNVNGPMGSPMHVNPMNSPIGPNMNGGAMNPGSNMSNPMGSGVGVMNVNGMNGPGPVPPPPPPSMNVNQQMNGPLGNPMGMNSSAGGPMGPHGPPMNNNFMMGPMGALYPKPMPVSAGKVYPADQPMVFNSQNPNAPPIYPCGVCHKEVHDNDQAILCESGCNFWFHRGCTGLTEAAFQLLTAEVYAEWVCDKCLNTKNIPVVKFKP